MPLLQAEMPAQRKRPQGGQGAKKGPPPDEAKWLTSCVLAPGAVRGGSLPSPAIDLASLPIEQRCVTHHAPCQAGCSPCMTHCWRQGHGFSGGM
jgi:hypothetical protein